METTRPRYPVIDIPREKAVTFRCVSVPVENPVVGILEGSAIQIEVDDRQYQILGTELGAILSTLYEAIDVETGDIVCLRFPGTF